MVPGAETVGDCWVKWHACGLTQMHQFPLSVLNLWIILNCLQSWELGSHNKRKKVKVTQLCPTLCNPMDWTVHGILQARILEWVPVPFSRGSSQPRDQTRSPTLQVDSLAAEPQGKPKNTGMGSLSLLQGIFLTQESNWSLLHCRWILYPLSYQGNPRFYLDPDNFYYVSFIHLCWNRQESQIVQIYFSCYSFNLQYWLCTLAVHRTREYSNKIHGATVTSKYTNVKNVKQSWVYGIPGVDAASSVSLH